MVPVTSLFERHTYQSWQGKSQERRQDGKMEKDAKECGEKGGKTYTYKKEMTNLAGV
jgi:hypothetical protein